MPAIEQNKLKRAGAGLRAVDHDRACPGFTLFAPMSGAGNVYLIDLDGKLIHRWQMTYPPGNYGYLTERGTLFYNGKTVEDSERFISRQPWKGGAVLEADWNGRVLWEVHHPDHHHDGIRLRNGNVLLLCLDRLPQNLARRCRSPMNVTPCTCIDSFTNLIPRMYIRLLPLFSAVDTKTHSGLFDRFTRIS